MPSGSQVPPGPPVDLVSLTEPERSVRGPPPSDHESRIFALEKQVDALWRDVVPRVDKLERQMKRCSARTREPRPHGRPR